MCVTAPQRLTVQRLIHEPRPMPASAPPPSPPRPSPASRTTWPSSSTLSTSRRLPAPATCPSPGRGAPWSRANRPGYSASHCCRPGKVNLSGERHQGKSGSGRKSSMLPRSSKQNLGVATPWSDWMVLVVSFQYLLEL